MTEKNKEELSNDEQILVNKGILEEMLLYIRESEVTIDAHEGQGRSWEELVKIYALPDVYYKINNLLKQIK
jgi:hypothetical protein